MFRRSILLAALIVGSLASASCTMQRQPMGEEVQNPVLILDPAAAEPLSAGILTTADAVDLPVAVWTPPEGQEPIAVLVAVHGLNDYARFFHMAGPYLAERGVVALSYDQRGFGRSDTEIGIWAGTETMVQDAQTAVALAGEQWPDLPRFVLGESMGGAVVLSALSRGYLDDVDGTILVAPGIWSRDAMPWYQRFALWLTATTAPGLTLSGDGFFDIWPTDNLEMLIEHSRDENVIKANRVDLLYGLVDLMDEAVVAAPEVLGAEGPGGSVLITYGDQEQVVYPRPVQELFRKLAEAGALPAAAAAAGEAAGGSDERAAYDRSAVEAAAGETRILFGFYPESYHMMLRDTVRETVLDDIIAFIDDPAIRTLPSGHQYRARGEEIPNPPPPVVEYRRSLPGS